MHPKNGCSIAVRKHGYCNSVTLLIALLGDGLLSRSPFGRELEPADFTGEYTEASGVVEMLVTVELTGENLEVDVVGVTGEDRGGMRYFAESMCCDAAPGG